MTDPRTSDVVPVSDPETLARRATERALFARMAANDLADAQAAFEALYRLVYPSVWRYALSIAETPDVAEELVQAAATDLWMRRTRIVMQTSVSAYLFVSVRNAAAKSARRQSVWQRITARMEHSVSGISTSPPMPDRALDSRAMEAALAHAVARLPEMRRTALLLRLREGMEYADIASALRVTPAAARQLVHRARETIARAVAPFRE